MNTLKKIFLGLSVLTCTSVYGQKAFEYAVEDRQVTSSFLPRQTVQLTNGTLLTVGEEGSGDGQWINYTISGDTIKTYLDSSPEDDSYRSVVTTQNGFVVAGSKQTTNGKEVQVKKFTNSGSLIWANTYTLPNEQYVRSIFRSANGDLIIASGTNYTSISVLKLDSLGTTITGWPKDISKSGWGIHSGVENIAFALNGIHLIVAFQDYNGNNKTRLATINVNTGTIGQDTLIGTQAAGYEPRDVIVNGSQVVVTGWYNVTNENRQFFSSWDTAVGGIPGYEVNIDLSPQDQGNWTIGKKVFFDGSDMFVLGHGWVANQGWHLNLRKVNRQNGTIIWSKFYKGDNEFSHGDCRESLLKLSNGQLLITSQVRRNWRTVRETQNWVNILYYAVINSDGNLNSVKYRLDSSFPCKNDNTELRAFGYEALTNFLWTAPGYGTTWNQNYVYLNSVGEYSFTATGSTGTVLSSDTIVIYDPVAPIIYNDLGSFDACAGDTIHLNAFSTVQAFAAQANFKWYLGGSIVNNGDSIISVTTPGTYELREIDTNGCAGVTTQVVNFNNPQVQIVVPTSNFNLTLGSGIVTNATTPNPDRLSAPWGYHTQNGVRARNQYIVTSAELQAMGLRSGMEISSIAFDVSSIGLNSQSANYIQDFSLSLINRPIGFSGFSLTSTSKWATVSLQNDRKYYDNQFYLGSTTGWKTLTFNQNGNFVWDGLSDVIIDIQYNGTGGAGSTNYQFNQSTTPHVSSKTSWTTSNSNSTNNVLNTASVSPTSNNRPNIRFAVTQVKRAGVAVACESPVQLTLNHSNIPNISSALNTLEWSQGTAFGSGSNFTSSIPGKVKFEFTDGIGCVATDSVMLKFGGTTVAIQSSVGDSSCSGSPIVLTASGASTGDSYSWSNGSNLSSAIFSASGNAVVTVIDSLGCSSTDDYQLTILDPIKVYTGTEPAYNGNTWAGHTYLGKVGNKFIYSSSGCKDYSSALASAVQAGGNLLTIGSTAEWNEVRQLLNNNWSSYYIGLNDIAQDGDWVWTSGSQSTWRPDGWMQGEPNGGAGEQCIQIRPADNWFNDVSQGTCGEYLVEFDENLIELTSASQCDSVQLFGPQGFDQYEWLSASGVVLSSGRTTYVSSTSTIALRATKTLADATTCVETTQNYTVNIVSSPPVNIVNLSNSFDIVDSLNFEGVTTATVFGWEGPNGFSSTSKSVWLKSPGTYKFFAEGNGCRTEKIISIYRPIFVAKTGNDQTGNGTIQAPYLTIQKGVNQASSGGKVYVLPGNYVESVVVTKPVKIYSDFERLGSTTAIGQTKITSQNGNFSIAIRMDSSGAVQNFTKQNMHISGFTIQGKNASNDMGAIDICPAPSFDWNNVNKQKGEVLISNIDFTNNTTQANNASAFASRGNEVHTYFENIKVRNSNIGVDPRGVLYFWQTKGGTFNNAQIFGNDGIVFNVDGQNMNMTFNNTAVFNNDIKGTTWGGYFNIQGSNNTLEFLNSTLSGNIMASQDARLFRTNNGSGTKVILKNSILNTGGNPVYSGQVSFEARHSLLPLTSVLALADFTYYDTTNVHSSVARVQGYELLPNSPAIGIGSVQYATATDIDGNNRPLPAGTNPDAGAFESNLAFGELDLAITSCGYQVIATVLNSKNYSISWSGPGGYSSTQTSPLLPSKGIYQATLIAFDRQDTIVRTLNLNNPLEFTIASVKDVCESVSSNSGLIQVSNMNGGTIYQLGWGDYYLRVYKNGSQVWQNNIYNGPTNVQNIGGLTSGTYVIRLEDAVGCYVFDTVELASKVGRKSFVSTVGLNTNTGTRLAPYQSVQYAVDQACDRDTIIILDGTYNEDSIYVDKPLVIASEYFLDGNMSHISLTKFIDSEDATFFYGGFNSSAIADTNTSQLVGITIEGGQNPHVDQWYGHGGAISVWNSVVKMDRLILKNNTAKDGGAIGLMGHGFTAVVANCTIDGNSAYSSGGGLTANLTGDLWIRNTSFTNNTANSGGGFWNQSNLVMSDVRIEGNSAQSQGGFWSSTISPWSSGTKRWTRVIVRNNVATSEFGGGYFQKSGSNSQFILDNVLIVNNAAQNYPGIHFGGYDDNRISIINSTIYGNTGSGTSQAAKNNVAFGDNTRIRLLNSIIGRSGGASGYTFYATNCGTKYLMADASSVIVGGATSIFEDNCGGQLAKSLTGIKTSVPYFVDPENGDYSLKNFSSLIGAGLASNSLGITSVSPNIAPLTLTATNKDVFGSARPNPSGSTIDIGAVENPLGVGVPGINVVVNGNGACQTTNGSATVNLVQVNGQPSGTPTILWIKLNDPTWTPQTTNTISGLSSGSYQVTVTVGTSAPFIDTAVVTTAAPMTLVNNSLLTNCFGGNDGTLKFSIQGGSPFTGGTYKYDVQQLTKDGGVASYTDNSTQERSANFMATQRSSGTYRISITDAKGCQFVDTITLGYRNALPTAQITASGPLSFCEGSSVSLNATTSNNTDSYSWNDGSNLAINTVGTGGSWIVTVTDTSGCANSDTVIVDVKATPVVFTGTPPAHTGGSIPSYAYLGELNGNHYYYSSGISTDFNTAKQNAIALGGQLWKVDNATEHQTVRNWITSSQGCCWAVWTGAEYLNGWQWTDGSPVTYNSFYSYVNPSNGQAGRMHLGDGNWDNDNKGAQYAYIVEFANGARNLATSESFCDSVTISAPAGFDSYVWKNTSNNNAVVGTTRTLKVTSSMTVKVEGVFAQTNGSTCVLESQTHSILMNTTPGASIVNYSGTTDLYGNDTVVLGISIDTGAVWNWYAHGINGSQGTNDTLLVTSPNYYTLSAVRNGCERRDSVRISQPRFVAKTGSNQNPGTLQQPYLTIQHAINQSNAGQKIYVLPGVYAEKVLIDRPIILQSNYDRLGDTSALHTTIIEPGTVGQITSALSQNIQASGGFNIIEQGSGRVEVSGFTIRNYVANYSGDWHKSSQFNIYNSDNVLVENLKLSGATQGQGQGCCNAAVVFEVQYSNNVEFDNVRIANNGTSSQNGHRLAYVNSSSVSVRNSRITNNYQDRGIHMESSYFLLENSLFSSNVVGDEGAFILGQNNNTLVWNFATARTTNANGSFPKLINVLGSNNQVAFLNSVLRQDVGAVVYNAGTSNSLEVKSSVAGLTLLGGAPSGITQIIDSLSTINTMPQILPNARLMPNSPAIGKGKLSSSAFGRNYTMPTKDLAGVVRPAPTGSMPDAGAYESNLAVGELDLSVTTCGYYASAVVLNSMNYQVLWTGPAGFSSTSLNPVLPVKGNYQVTLIALDRQDTIVRIVALNNPLEFTTTSVKDVCEGVGTNSGSITWGNITGGVNNNNPNQWWKKKTSILNSNGSQFDGEWWVDNSSWTTTRSGMPSGTFIIKVIDGAGCAVYDTVVISAQPSNTYFISTTGSDSALGTAANPLKTISEALTRACDGDTIILEDGRHYENVIMGNNSPRLTIASRYLLDGDTNHIHNAIVDGMDVNPVFNISNLNNRGTTDTLRLLGFTVTKGLANSGWNGGGGISARWSNVSLVKIRAVENRSGQNGGGIGIWECDLKLKDVLIKDNFATNDGGGLHLQYINNDLLNTNVRIVGNQSSNGGGLYYSHGLGNTGQVYELDGFEVINNLATNQGGGIFFGCWSGEADVQLSNSKVIGNRAANQSGGIVVQSNNANFFFVNDIIAKNESGYAGAMSINNSKAHFVHSTVYSNKHILGSTSSILNLAVHVENQSSLKMYNSILGGQGTGGKNVYIQDNNSNFEIVSGQLGGGVSNTVQAPNTSQIIFSPSSPNYTDQQVFLKDPNGGDYSLAKVSQAIGRGLTSFTNGPSVPLVDIYGNARPNLFGSDPDFGAIESNDTAASFGVAFVVSDNNACNPSIGQITAFPQNGSGAYTYTWTALTSGGIISNPTGAGASHTIANLFTGQYQVAVTDVVNNITFIDTATVRGDSPLVLNKVVTDEGCQGTNSGAISVDVTGGSGFYTYTWLLPNGGVSNTKNISNLSPGIYSVTVTDNKGCSVSSTDTVGTSFAQPTLNITSQIVKAGGTSVSGGSDVRMCIGDQVVFNAGSGFDYYEWNKSDGLNTEYSQTVSSYVSETYTVYVEDTNGCSTTGTAKIFVVYEPNVYASNVNRTMGQQFQQVTSYVRGDTTAQSNVTSQEVSPYNAQGNSLKKSQFVISASELQGAGLTENTTINSLAFDVVNPAGVAFQAYKIKLAHTTAQQLGSWQSPADQQEVFAIPVYAPVQGWNTHNFTNAFAWNGVDNLLVEVCYTPIGNTWNSASVRVNQVATANTLTNFSNSANTCSDPVQNWQMGSSTWRPTVRFGIDKVEVLDTIRVCDFTTLNTTDDYDTYTWYVNGVASPTAALALNLTSPASVVLAATDAASSCVMYSDTFYVALDTTPTVLATSNIVGALCAGDSVVLSTPSVGLASYLWSNGDTSMTSTVFESGSYILEARSANGCAGTDTVVVNVNTPPTVVVKLNGKTLTATDGSLATKVNTCVQSVLLPFGENFEDSLYVWTQTTTDQLDWTLNSGATNTQFSGPNGDFTTTDSSGNYYYLDRAGSNSDDNKEAHLISPCVQMIGASRPYLTFGYHMYNGLYNAVNPSSDNMGTLRIEVQTTDDAANYWVPLWTKTGHQGIGWKSDTVDLTQFAGQTIRLRIVGKAGIGGPRSEMAIDGISIIDTANSFANTSGRISADIICEGDLLIAQTISNGSTQFDYVWNTGDTTSALKVDTTGYYFVSVMDENGCSIVTDSVWIEVSPIPDNALVVTGDLSNCYNETVAVTVQAPMNYSKYSWFSNDSTIVPSGTTTTLVSMQGLAIGNYALGVRIFDSIGCAAISDTVVVNRYIQPMIQDSVVPVACFGDSTGSIVVTPITGPMSWSWSNGDSTSANFGLPTGLYTLVFTDEHGCSDTTSMNVIEPAPLALTFSNPSTQPVSCFGGADGSIVPIVTGGNGGYQYSWSGTQFGSTSDTLSGLNAGTYVLNVLDAKGCFISDTHVVVEPAILSATVDSTWNASCYQANDGWISVNVAGGNGGYLMNWINSLGQSVGSNDTVTNLLAGTYQFIVTDLKGCTDSVVQVVTEPQVLDLSTVSSVFVGGNNIRCVGDSSGAITTTTVGGTLPYQWQWSNGSVADNIDSLIAGTYSVVVTDLRGCQDSATVVLSEPTELLGSAVVQDVLCHDDQSGSVVVTNSGAVAPYWLDWATTGVDSGMTRVTLVLDLRSATSINSPSVGIVGTVNNVPMVTYHNDSIYYLTIERQPGTTVYYRFYNGASPELVPTSCGINPPGLTDLHRTLVVGSNDTTLNRVCFASCVDCDGQVTGARSEVLVGGSTTISSQGSGVITLTIVDANGCSVTINDTIVQPDAINIQLDTIVDVSCPQAGDGSIQLTTIGGIMPYAFDWSNGDTIEDLLTVNEGTHTITVTDFNGCVDTASYEILAPMPYNFEEICMMTVDSLTGKNQVVWNKTPGQRTMEYQIFKETNVAGQYVQIGTVPYLNMSVFTDVNSVPQQQPDRYKIVAVDSCGNTSDTSDLHRTIHLQSNFGSGGEVNLSWTDYEGRTVQTYDIFRWVSAGNLVQIGSVSGATTTFSDLNPPVAPNVYYNVRAVFAGGACAPAAGKTSSYESARSNILDQTGIGMPDLPWKGLARMFPNPTNSAVRIEVPESGFVVRVTNMLGQLIHETSVQESSVVLDLGHVAAGMYQVELYRDGQVMSIDKLHVVH